MSRQKIKKGNARAKDAIRGAVHSYRSVLSKKLGQWDGQMNMRQRWICYTLVLFAIVSLLTWNLIGILHGPSKASAIDTLEPMAPYGIEMKKMPRYDPMKGRAIGMLRYLDSLKNNAVTKASYDSILHARPGLMDSITYYINR